MKEIRFKPLLLLFLFYSCPTIAGDADAVRKEGADKLGVGQNIGFVEKLVHESAASRQILESNNQAAMELRNKALDFLAQAKAANERGDKAAVTAALNKAKMTMFKGMRLVGNKASKQKKQDDFNKKRKGLASLLQSHRRIRKEQQPSEKTSAEVERHTQEKMRQAQHYYDKGELVKARKVLDNAYLSLKLSLTRLRDGQTLRRELHFETKADEYKYELRRNDTHMTLINTVLKEKREDPRLGKLMDIPLNEAEKQRVQAKDQAENGDYDAAIKTLEQSTANIIRAIRLAGIFIPG